MIRFAALSQLSSLLPLAAIYSVQEKPPAKTMDLDGLIQITDPAKCDFGAQFNDIGDRLFVYDAATKKINPGILAVPDEYNEMFGRPEFQEQDDGTMVLTLPVTGRFKGLQMVAIVTSANAAGKPGKTMFVIKTDYDTAYKRISADIALDEKSAFSVNRIAEVTDHITMNCEQK
jgi:hypothetical protein